MHIHAHYIYASCIRTCIRITKDRRLRSTIRDTQHAHRGTPFIRGSLNTPEGSLSKHPPGEYCGIVAYKGSPPIRCHGSDILFAFPFFLLCLSLLFGNDVIHFCSISIFLFVRIEVRAGRGRGKSRDLRVAGGGGEGRGGIYGGDGGYDVSLLAIK